MTSKKDFTADEWKVICDAPLAVGGAVAAAAPSGVIGNIKEGVALVNSMRHAAERHPHNQLIQDVVPRGASREQIDLWTKVARAMMHQSESARLASAALEACQRVATILQSKTDPQEADEFKRWLLETGEDVADAAKDTGSVGIRMSSQEAQILSMMASALGVTHIPGPSSPESYQYPSNP
jgi:hypothetical protein